MTRRSPFGTRRGFTQVELAAVVVVGALLVTLGETRRQARLGEDIAKLRQIGAWTASYASDNSDLLWSFSWKAGVVYHSTSTSIPVWPAAPTDLQAAANQAVDILHRRADRPDIPMITFWVPHILYNHLVLEDYLRSPVPDFVMISSMDKHRIKWARDPKGFDMGLYQPAPTSSGPGTSVGKRWPYSSSFQVPPAFFDGSPVGQRMYQASNHNQYFVPNGTLGGRLQGAVAFPSLKVLLHDQHARHFGARVPYFGYPQARVPLLFADGSVCVCASSDANIGWHPNQPSTPGSASFPMMYNYTPDVWEPPTMSGAGSELITKGFFRWTRGTATEHGIAGRDYGGPETCSGQPGCP